ncbi:MAG TPA: phosphatase PAP2 family protein [Candidatus Acidoferrales bacterium]|jgi:membrane-associated phospholipid phosphatase|nr:phosphatase PAP2 family protein [Candidatus Acidoferrales bacterium]
MGKPRPNLPRELIVALGVALGAAAVFVWLAALVMSGQAGAFDTAVRAQVHAASSPALTYIMRGFTMLGEAGFLVMLGALIVWRLVALGRRPEAAWLAVAALGAEALDQALKFWFRRPRPAAFFGVAPANSSFPSGHALVSFCFYLVLAEIFIGAEWPRGRRFAARTVAVLLAGWVGLSRIYLGVHYPTDVLAGYAAAIVWLAVLRSLYRVRRQA